MYTQEICIKRVILETGNKHFKAHYRTIVINENIYQGQGKTYQCGRIIEIEYKL